MKCKVLFSENQDMAKKEMERTHNYLLNSSPQTQCKWKLLTAWTLRAETRALGTQDTLVNH